MPSFTQFTFTAILLLFAVATNVHGEILHAKWVLHHLNERAVFYGGLALSHDTSSADMVTCPWVGACCIADTVCDSTGGGAYCCPTTDDCGPLVDALPVCADPSWSIWQGDGVGTDTVDGPNVIPKYFCCEAGEIGLVNDLCAPSGVPVTTGQATLIAAGTGSGAIGLATTSSHVATTSATVTSGVETTTTAISSTPTSVSSSKSGGGVGGILTSIESAFHPSSTSTASSTGTHSNAGDKVEAMPFSFIGIIAGLFGAALL